MATKLRALALALTLLPAAALASGGEAPYSFKADTLNKASLQRGAAAFMNYCSGCHSLKYLRYNRVGGDLDIPDEVLKKNLMFTTDKVGEHILSSMPAASKDPANPSDPEKWFGRAPPDLSLTAREHGADWVFSYLLTFYLDPSRPTGVNNLVLPGASMPHVLADLQGYNRLETHEGEGEGHGGHHRPKLIQVQAGSLSPVEYKEFVGDLTNFLVYAAEPGRNMRIGLGFPVLLFVIVFGIFCYLLKLEYWKDVH
jgi:ubiquinol-cytochrome c reductase cytochrome c1 subunit